MSQTAVISNSSGSDWRTGRWTTCATSPSPMMPTRNFVTGNLPEVDERVPSRRRRADGAKRSERGDRRPAGLGQRRLLDRLQHALHLEPLTEGRRGVATGGDVGDEVGDLVGERVLVA